MRRLPFAVLAAFLAFPAPAGARELGTAPELRILGFSADGRHFGFEQEGGDGVSDKGAFAVDVVERDSGRSVSGFPRGATQLTFDSAADDPRRQGIQGLRFREDDEATVATAAIRRWVRQVSRRPLQTLRLTDPGRRLGGRAITDLSASEGPVRVMDRPDIVGAHPGTSMKYAVTAEMPVPADPDLACRERETSATHRLTVTLAPEIPSWDPEAATRNPEPFRTRAITLDYTLPPRTCLIATRVTDVLRNEAGTSIAVVVALLIDVGFTDSAEYRAVLFGLPRP